jgi:hypothetical protein
MAECQVGKSHTAMREFPHPPQEPPDPGRLPTRTTRRGRGYRIRKDGVVCLPSAWTIGRISVVSIGRSSFHRWERWGSKRRFKEAIGDDDVDGRPYLARLS